MNKQLFLAALLLFTPTLLSSAVAQDHGPPAGGSDRNLRDSASDLKGRSNEIDRIERDAKKTDSRVRDAEEPESLPAPNFPQIKEDFERIQIINSDVLQAIASKPDYGRVSESAGEIEKRAIRLKSNLFAPKSTKQSKENEPVAEDQELKSLLTLLDNSIGTFTQNPMFQNSKVVNPQDSTNAQKELDAVIKISARIRIEADRMKKANSPPE
jgi:hypothetical protein